MATLVQVENAVAALLVALGGRTIVQGRIGEDGAPSTPYAMWRLDRISLDDFTRTELNGTDQIVIASNTPLEFVINIVGGAAMTDMVRFCLSLRQSQRTADLYKLCGLSGVGPMQDLSALEVGTYRQRVEVRLTLFTALELTAPVELIETICMQVLEPLKEFDETYCMTQGECH
jgi:hypothetical protein